MNYGYHSPSWGLGNFINMTPTLRYLAKGDKYPVFTNVEWIRKAYQACPFIRFMGAPSNHTPIVSSAMVDKSNTIPDYIYLFEKVTGEKWDPSHHTYIDPCGPIVRGGYTVLVNGAGNLSPSYVASKDPGPAYYLDVMQREECIFVGSEADLSRNPWARKIAVCIGDIRETLRLIARADRVVANDTGLAHAAAAMRKELTCLWVNTPAVRCKHIGENTRVVHCV